VPRIRLRRRSYVIVQKYLHDRRLEHAADGNAGAHYRAAQGLDIELDDTVKATSPMALTTSSERQGDKILRDNMPSVQVSQGAYGTYFRL